MEYSRVIFLREILFRRGYICPMKWIDTHAHIYLPNFESDLKEVVTRMLDAGVEKVLLPDIDSAHTRALYILSEMYPEIFFSMCGLHPCSVGDSWQEELAHVEKELATGRHYAVGEIGLDYYWDTTHADKQREVFRTQLRWAKELNLPVAIHTREAFDDVFQILEEEQDGSLKGVLHCFTGNAEQAARGVALGMHLGIGGVVTYKNGGLDKALLNVPLNCLLVETDSPYLPPIPHRGKRNESSYLPIIGQRLAEIMGVSTEEMADITTANAKKLFSLS
jgi:TatD DNase family protein